jgi:hypothetical protein
MSYYSVVLEEGPAVPAFVLLRINLLAFVINAYAKA